ncbi:MAG: metal dependent phosphohydrolase, partial [Bacteriovoracaceae bacterium]|nr:metal dependent phosphohydrolase [Bacteriovoracaceae bacterium]
MGVRVDLEGASLLTNQYFKVPINLYQPEDMIEEDLYFLYQGNYLLYRLKNLIWKQEDQKKLRDFEVEHLFIRCASEKDHNQFLENKLKRILEQPSIGSREKAEIVYSTSTSLIQDLFANPDSPEALKRSMTAVQNVINYLSKDKSHFFE